MKCCDITSGMLNRKADLYSLTASKTATGTTRAWVFVATIWCSIKNSSGTERVHGDKLKAIATSKFTMRYRDDITETSKLVYNNTDYQVRHIDNIEEADKWLIVKCEKGVVQ